MRLDTGWFLEIPFLQSFVGKWQESQCSLQEEAAAGPLFVQLPNTDEGGEHSSSLAQNYFNNGR